MQVCANLVRAGLDARPHLESTAAILGACAQWNASHFKTSLQELITRLLETPELQNFEKGPDSHQAALNLAHSDRAASLSGTLAVASWAIVSLGIHHSSFARTFLQRTAAVCACVIEEGVEYAWPEALFKA